MIKVGITGGIGSGKTTICEVFKTLGVPVFHADTVAKQLQDSDPEIKDGLRSLFGKKIYSLEGRLNRPKLAKLIFGDKQLLEKVNSVIHPKVRKSFIDWSNVNKDYFYGLYEAAILFESGYYKDCDFNILVIADESLRIDRVAERNGLIKSEIENRIKNQLSDEVKIPLADFVIQNSKYNLVIPQVLEFDKLIKHYGKVR
jgi:dephospho-CoA kinase